MATELIIFAVVCGIISAGLLVLGLCRAAADGDAQLEASSREWLAVELDAIWSASNDGEQP